MDSLFSVGTQKKGNFFIKETKTKQNKTKKLSLLLS